MLPLSSRSSAHLRILGIQNTALNIINQLHKFVIKGTISQAEIPTEEGELILRDRAVLGGRLLSREDPLDLVQPRVMELRGGEDRTELRQNSPAAMEMGSGVGGEAPEILTNGGCGSRKSHLIVEIPSAHRVGFSFEPQGWVSAEPEPGILITQTTSQSSLSSPPSLSFSFFV